MEEFTAIVALAIMGAIGLFCLAWVTILPTIGLLYWLGYLK